MMEIKFTGPAFAVIAEMREFIAGFEREADCPPLPIAPEAFAAALDATTSEPAKKRGRPKKQPLEQQHAPEVAPLSENAELMVEAVVAEMEQQEAATEPDDTPNDKSLAVPDIDAIKAAFRAYANTNGIEAASALLAEFGINKPSELATDELKVEFFGRLG
jgi:hypothetical protein